MKKILILIMFVLISYTLSTSALYFTETYKFNSYINEYNRLTEINSLVAKLNYKRIGVLNLDNNFIYTIYLNKQGKIIKIADGFDNVDFVAEMSISRIENLIKQSRFEDIQQEIKIPFKVKLKILWWTKILK